MPLAKRRFLNEQSFVMPAAAHRTISRVFGSLAAGKKIRDHPPPLNSVPSPRGAEQNGTLWAGGVCVALKANIGKSRRNGSRSESPARMHPFCSARPLQWVSF